MDSNKNKLSNSDQLSLVLEKIKQQYPGQQIHITKAPQRGLSGAALYLVHIDDQPALLKLLEQPNLNSFRYHQKAAEVAIAPKLLYYDLKLGFSLSEWIASQPLQDSFQPAVLSHQLATTLSKLHRANITGNRIHVFDKIQAIIDDYQQSLVIHNQVIDTTIAQFQVIKSVYPFEAEDLVPCHGDLNPSNILTDSQQIYLIDWEAAHIGNRYVDLAAICNSFFRTKEDEQAFLEQYLGHPASETEEAKLYLMRICSRLLYALLMLHLADKGRPSDTPLDSNMEGMTLAYFTEQIASKNISLGTYEGQLLYSKACFNQVHQEVSSNRYAKTINYFA